MPKLDKDTLCVRTGLYFTTLAEIKYNNENTDTHIGVIFATIRDSNYGSAYYARGISVSTNDYRLATWREKLAYKEGIYHINDIPERIVFKDTICVRIRGEFSHTYFPNIEKKRDIGRIFKTIRTREDGRFTYAGTLERKSSASSAFIRIATPEEVEAFEAGITHIDDIKNKTINNNLKQEQNGKTKDYKETAVIDTGRSGVAARGNCTSSRARLSTIKGRCAGNTTSAKHQKTRINNIKISFSAISK